jgi:hypothetical protein
MAEFGFGIEASAAALALTLMIGLAGLSVLAPCPVFKDTQRSLANRAK